MPEIPVSSSRVVTDAQMTRGYSPRSRSCLLPKKQKGLHTTWRQALSGIYWVIHLGRCALVFVVSGIRQSGAPLPVWVEDIRALFIDG